MGKCFRSSIHGGVEAIQYYSNLEAYNKHINILRNKPEKYTQFQTRGEYTAFYAVLHGEGVVISFDGIHEVEGQINLITYEYLDRIVG